jgi:hypothetical protein
MQHITQDMLTPASQTCHTLHKIFLFFRSWTRTNATTMRPEKFSVVQKNLYFSRNLFAKPKKSRTFNNNLCDGHVGSGCAALNTCYVNTPLFPTTSSGTIFQYGQRRHWRAGIVRSTTAHNSAQTDRDQSELAGLHTSHSKPVRTHSQPKSPNSVSQYELIRINDEETIIGNEPVKFTL